MIYVNSQGGRIGPLWWLNSDQTPIPSERMFNGAVQGRRFIRWGTAGIGTDFRVSYEEAA